MFARSCKQSLTTRYETPEDAFSGLTNRIIGATQVLTIWAIFSVLYNKASLEPICFLIPVGLLVLPIYVHADLYFHLLSFEQLAKLFALCFSVDSTPPFFHSMRNDIGGTGVAFQKARIILVKMIASIGLFGALDACPNTLGSF